MTELPVARRRRAVAALTFATLLALAGPGAAEGTPPDENHARPAVEAWSWPIEGARVAHPYEAPAHRYAPGHRGIDLRPPDDRTAVRAPADGTVAFSGMVAGRPVLTIDHGNALVTTLEPLETALTPGARVLQGDEVGTIAIGGHTDPGAVHFGVRWHGEYINPLLLLDGIPRAVLLPCC